MFKFIKNKNGERKRLEEEENKRKEEERKRLEEDRIRKQKIEEQLEKRVYQQLNNDTRLMTVEMNMNIVKIFSVMKLTINILKKIDCNIDFDQIYNLFYTIYKKTYDTKGIGKYINNIISDMLRDLESKFNYYPTTIYNSKYNVDLQKHLQQELNIYMNLERTNTIFQSLYHNEYSCLSDFIDQLNEIFGEQYEDMQVDKELLKNNVISYLYFLVVALVKTILLLQNRNEFISNQEMFKIGENYIDKFAWNKYIDKLYPLYKEFYKETFSEILTIAEFGILSMSVFTIKEIEGLKENILQVLHDDKFCEVEQFSKSDMYEYMLKLDDDSNEELDSFEFKIKYCTFITMLKNIPALNRFELLWELDNVREKIEKYKTINALTKEKERFLSDDFTKEEAIKKDELDLARVNSGQEFELYLKNIFEKLGYYVEQTKATGDQGADLIMIKNNKKTVAQVICTQNPGHIDL